jgi:hypothetical protein
MPFGFKEKGVSLRHFSKFEKTRVIPQLIFHVEYLKYSGYLM